MSSSRGQFLYGIVEDVEDYFVTDYDIIDRYIGDSLWNWGLNNNQQLGSNITDSNRLTPNTISVGGTNWKSVSCGFNFAAAVKLDGTLWTWGDNTSGQLGVNDTVNRSTPVTTFAGGTNWKSVSCGLEHVIATKTDGTLWTWGLNSSGQLGVNDTAIRSTPVTTFAGGTDWNFPSAGNYHSSAIKLDGTLWVWGYNFYGGLGVNDTANRSTPVTTFAGGTDWKSVSCGTEHTVAIDIEGTLWTWGRNTSGQLGVNDTTDRSTPVTTLSGVTPWRALSNIKNSEHTVAIKSDGTLWVWGKNTSGQLGVNDTTNRSTPVTTFAGGNDWKVATTGSTHTVAIKSDGNLWSWGSNAFGQLGDNTTVGKSTPVTTITGETDWKSVSCGNDFTTAIRSGYNIDVDF